MNAGSDWGGCTWQASSDGGKGDEELNENWDCLGRKNQIELKGNRETRWRNAKILIQ